MSTYGAEASIKHLQLRSASIEAPPWYTELCNLRRYDELQIYTYGAVRGAGSTLPIVVPAHTHRQRLGAGLTYRLL